MKETRIDWTKVRIKMAERGIRSVTELAEGAGIHRNTLYKDGQFHSTVMDRLANFFDCGPCDIITFEELGQRTGTRPH